MLDFIKNILQWLFVPEESLQEFSGQYQNSAKPSQKTKSINTVLKLNRAIQNSIFFKRLNCDFSHNVELYEKLECPYCGAVIELKKSKTFKCSSCGAKIYIAQDILTEKQGFFTAEEKAERDKIKKEISRRKNFLSIYENAKEYVDFYPTTLENENILILTGLLHEAKKYTSKPSKADSLRMCRFYEGELCNNINGGEKSALNAYLATAYIDLWGRYNIMYKYDKKNNKQFLEDKIVAPGVMKRIEKFNYDIEILKGLFYFYAKEQNIMLSYKPPITIDEAWKLFEEQYLE